MRFIVHRVTRNRRRIPGARRDPKSGVQFIEIETLADLEKLSKKVQDAVIVEFRPRPLRHYVEWRRRKEFEDRSTYPVITIFDAPDP